MADFFKFMNFTFSQINDHLLSYDDVFLDHPFGEDVFVYKVKLAKGDKIFALLAVQKGIFRISLKCEPQLAEALRQKYESVLPGYHLAKKHWNTIILSGQLTWQEVVDLISHSYQLVSQT